MNKRVLVLLVLVTTFAAAHGEIIHDSLYSASLNRMRNIDVYLPPNYHAGSDSFPVIYFLHGIGAIPQDYSPMISVVVDALIFGNAIDPIIVALPDGNCEPYSGSLYTNSALYGAFEDFAANDAVNYIETAYRARSGRANRAIMGHSMGGYGAMKIAIKHAARYYGVASLSGFVSVVPFDYWQSAILEENNGQGPYDPLRGFFTQASFAAAGAFTPNLNNPPYYIDYPLNNDGDIIEPIFRIWQQQMPGYLSRLHPDANTLAIYFDCGQQDELGFFSMNQYFAAQLDSQGIAHRFEPFIGDHTNQLIVRGMMGFMFLDSVRHVLTAEPAPTSAPSAIALLRNYPNPFNSGTRIEFTLPRAGHVELSVYDLLGRETIQLLNGVLSTGAHAVNFNAANLPSGVYLCRLTSGGETQTRKMLLIR